MCVISHSVLTSACCHILADGCDIVLDLGGKAIVFHRYGTHQWHSNLPGRFLSLELPLYRAPIVSRRRRANPNHSSASSLSCLLSGALFSTDPGACDSATRLRDWRFDGGIDHLCERRGARPFCFTPSVRVLFCQEEAGPRWVPPRLSPSPSVCLTPSLRTCCTKVTVTGRCGGRGVLQISLAILHDSRCSNRFHAGLCLVSSSGWHSDLISIHGCQMN